MILYGGLTNSFNVLDIGNATPFSRTGAVTRHLAIQEEQLSSFPMYGAVVRRLQAPTHHKILGAVTTHKIAPIKFKMTFATSRHTALGANALGLQINNLKDILRFPTPANTYDIYPYVVSDIYKVLGTTNPYVISASKLTFETAPTGTITVVPFNRLQLYVDDIEEMIVTNIIPDRAEFSNIVVSGDFGFSLSKTGPWTNTLQVTNKFYVKALTGSTTINITADVLPRG